MQLSTILVITLCFGIKELFIGVSAFTTKETELIVADLTSDILMEHHQIRQLSPKCWIHALQTVPYENDNYGSAFPVVKVSSGAKFCSFLEAETNKYFSLALTKCHFDESGRNGLPRECYSSEIGSYISDIRSCTSKMSEESFLVYTKFLLHVNQICTKLTEELKIQEQTIAAAKFQQSAFEMQKKMEESFKMQDEIQKNMKDQHDLISRQKDFSRTMQVEMQDILRNLSQQQEYVLVQQDVIKKMKDLYQTSGIEKLQKSFQDMKDLVMSFYMWFRYVCILSVVVTACFISKRFRRARTIVAKMVIIEVILEWSIMELEKIDAIPQDSGVILIEYLRSHDLFVYVLISALCFLLSFGKGREEERKHGENSNKVLGTSISSDTRISVDLLKENMMRERALYQFHHEHFQRQIAELQRQLEANSRNIIIASQLHKSPSSYIIPSVMNSSLENDDSESLAPRTPLYQAMGEIDTQGQSTVVSECSPIILSRTNTHDINIHKDADVVTPSSSKSSTKRKSRDDDSDDESISSVVRKKRK